MGYTHYWSYDPTHPSWRPSFAQLQLDSKLIIDAVRARGIRIVRINYNWKKRPPTLSVSNMDVIQEGEMMFNGWRPPEEETGESDDYSCEDFYMHVEPDSEADSCKTERRPYDLAVTTILLRAYVLMPEHFVLGSDGGWDDEWLRGAEAWIGSGNAEGVGARKLYEKLFEPLPSDYRPIDMEELDA